MEPSDGEEDDQHVLGGSDDDDDDDDGCGALLGDARARRMGAASDDDEDEEPGYALNGGMAGSGDDDEDDDDDDDVPAAEEDDDDDDDDEEDARGAKGYKQRNIMQMLGGSSTSSKQSAPAPSKKGKAPAAPPAAGKPAKGKAKAFVMDQGSDDEDGSDGEPMTRVGGLVKKPPPLAAVDPVEEHDQLRRAHANGALPKDAADAADDGRVTAEVPPKVSPHVISQFFLLKNDKGPAAKRFYGMTGMRAFDDRPCTEAVHAPNWTDAKNCAFTITVEQVLAPRKDRDAMLTKLANERMKELLQEVQIYKVPVDPTSTGSGPGIVNVAGFLPCRVEDENTEAVDQLRVKVAVDDSPLPFLLPIDEKLMKRMYKVGRGTLPRMYDPNVNGIVKYRVWGKLEDQAKIDGNLEVITPPAPAAKSKRKRPAENGGGAAAKKAPAPPVATDADDEAEEEDVAHMFVEPCFTKLKWTGIPSMGVAMAGIQEAPGTDVRLIPVGEGNYILVKTPSGP